jgi:pimeloyl-ACP methyl ester carboxylesterase
MQIGPFLIDRHEVSNRDYAEFVNAGGYAREEFWKHPFRDGETTLSFAEAVARFREHAIRWVSELRYSLDYLHTRQDVDPKRIGYQGISYGSVWPPLFLALEPRLRTGLLIGGGFAVMQFSPERFPPEIDPLNFAPRVTVPVLMLNGRHDPLFPYETSQLPMYRTLGITEADKRHAIFPSGHSSWSWWNELIRESHDWLDRYFRHPEHG